MILLPSSTAGIRRCNKCPKGYSYNVGSQRCSKCKPGSFRATRGLEPVCEPCPLNTFGSTFAAESKGACSQCPAHSHTLEQGSTSAASCVCDDGFFTDADGGCIQDENISKDSNEPVKSRR